MPGRRRSRPGLLGTVARTAVITKTATTVAGSSQRKAAAQQPQQQAPQQPAAPQVVVVPAQASAAPPVDRMAALRELGELRAAGVLTEEEFAAEKARILQS